MVNFRWSNDAAGTGETAYMELDTSTTGGWRFDSKRRCNSLWLAF